MDSVTRHQPEEHGSNITQIPYKTAGICILNDKTKIARTKSALAVLHFTFLLESREKNGCAFMPMPAPVHTREYWVKNKAYMATTLNFANLAIHSESLYFLLFY